MSDWFATDAEPTRNEEEVGYSAIGHNISVNTGGMYELWDSIVIDGKEMPGTLIAVGTADLCNMIAGEIGLDVYHILPVASPRNKEVPIPKTRELWAPAAMDQLRRLRDGGMNWSN